MFPFSGILLTLEHKRQEISPNNMPANAKLQQPWKQWYKSAAAAKGKHYVVPYMAAGNLDEGAEIKPSDESGDPEPQAKS